MHCLTLPFHSLPAHIYKWEDARTGQWLRNLDPTTDPVTTIDNGFSMGDYNQLDLKESTVALRQSLPYFRP